MVANERFLKGIDTTKNHEHKPIESIRDYQRYRMYVVQNGTGVQRELVFGEVSWGDNIESLGLELNVSLPRNVKDRHLAPYDIVNVGDGIIFKNLENIIFEGMVETVGLNEGSKDLTCYDYGYLLGKTAILKQFNDVKGHKAIESICNQRGIPVGRITPMNVSITEIYNNKTVSDIFKEIIQKENENTGKRIVMEMRGSRLYVEDMNTQVVELSHKPAANLSPFNPAELPGDISKSATIDNMKNYVQIVYQETENDVTTARTVATASNENSINKYGRRVYVESISEDDINNAQTIANNRLRELEKMEINLTIEMLGDDRLRSGRVIEVENKEYNLRGRYTVLNCEQTYANNNRRMTLELEGV